MAKRAVKASKKAVRKAAKKAAKREARQGTKVVPATFVRGKNGHIKLSLGEGFDATDSDRTRRTRAAVDSGADRHMTAATMTKLREMGRDYDRNSGMVSGMLDRWSGHVVGPELVFEPATRNNGWNKEAKAWFTDHMGPDSDARGMVTLRDNLAMTLRSVGTDGDQLKIFLGKTFSIQTIEAHQIATPFDRRSTERIVNGVRLNAQGAATGFWVSKDAHNGFIARKEDARLIRTRDTLWPAYRKRPSATRGLPVMASSLSNYDRLDAYIDNEMLAAQIDACLTFWISRTQDFADGQLGPGETEQVVGASDGTSTTEKLQSVKPGAIFDLQGDESVNQFGGNRPGKQFEPFIVTGMRMFGAAMGLPLELLLLDYSRTNYSSARAAILEAHESTFRKWQQWTNDYLAVPIYRRWIFQAMAKEELPFNPEWQNVKWFWPVSPYIDPLKAALAVREAIAGGWWTVTKELARNGVRIEDHVAERSHELNLFRENDIPTTTVSGATQAGNIDPLTLTVLQGDNSDDGANNTNSGDDE